MVTKAVSLGAAAVISTLLVCAASVWLGQVRELATLPPFERAVQAPPPSRPRLGTTRPGPWAPVDPALYPVVNGEHTARRLQILAR